MGNPQLFQKEFILRTLTGLLQCMQAVGVVPAPSPSDKPHHHQHKQQLLRAGAAFAPAVLCRKSYWIYTSVGGVLSVLPAVTEVVRKGQIIAQVTDIFGVVTATYTAPETGIVVCVLSLFVCGVVWCGVVWCGVVW